MLDHIEASQFPGHCAVILKPKHCSLQLASINSGFQKNWVLLWRFCMAGLSKLRLAIELLQLAVEFRAETPKPTLQYTDLLLLLLLLMVGTQWLSGYGTMLQAGKSRVSDPTR
jgi:hypothetical protein